VREEHRLNRKLAMVRVYYHFGEDFPMRADLRLMTGHQTLLVSLDGTRLGPTFASVAAGREDRFIRRFLKAMNDAAVLYHLGVIYFCYQHEPNVRRGRGLGSRAQFRRAWDHVRELARGMHLTRLRWVLILTHRDYLPPGHRPRWMHGMPPAAAVWPGKRNVDVVAADGYDSPGCKPGTSPRNDHATPGSVFGPVLRFARAHGRLPVFASEWGASARFPAAQAKFIREMPGFVARHHAIRGVSYWDQAGPTCSYSVNHRPRALAALRAMAHDRALLGHVSGA
jgi:hypothetical protein